MPLSHVSTYNNKALMPYKESPFWNPIVVNLAAGDYPIGQVLGEYNSASVNEIQTLTITGAPTGGSYVLGFDGQNTAPIAYNAAASAVKLALEALSNIDIGDVVVAGGPHPGAAITVEYSGKYGKKNVVQIVSVSNTFTGGAAPALTVTTTTAGSFGVGTFDKYNDAGANGLNEARAILRYACKVDSAGRIAQPNDLGQTNLTIECFSSAVYLKTTDLVGLDAAAVADFRARIVQGTLADGIIYIP